MPEPIRLNIGAGPHKAAGYVSVDAYHPAADIHADAACLPYPNESVETIVTSHMVEHLAEDHFLRALREWKRVLIPGGRLEIRCPNIEHYLQKWLASSDEMRFGEGKRWLVGWAERGDGYLNRNVFTPRRLAKLVSEAGFLVERASVFPTRDGYTPDGDCLCIARKPR